MYACDANLLSLGSVTDVHKSWLTPVDRATRCVTSSRHRAAHKAGRWVWSTGDGRRSTVDNTSRRSTCRREIILSWEVGKSSRVAYAYFWRYSKFI